MRRLAACLAVLALPGAAAAAPVSVTEAQLTAADTAKDWLSYGHGPAEQRFSPLAQITSANAAKLGLAWFADLDTSRGQEATPLAVDGVLYTTTAWSMVKAYDGQSGKLLWSYDPGVDRAKGVDACCDVVNRGVAIYGGLVFVGTLDGRLIALHAATGKPAWSVQTTDPAKHYTITMAPRIAKGRVLIGNGGGEYGVRGYISAYDAQSGKLAWRFYTVPNDPKAGPDHAASDPVMARAAKTWSGEWWKLGGGGTVWDAISYDPTLNRIYFGTSNATPWNQKYASPKGGDTLFLASIVAVNADTGAYVWHYQATPGESWDFDATQQLVQADLTIGGVKTPALMQANKNGYFYVLDRRSGKLISAANFAPVTWATGIDMRTGRPIENPDAHYERSGKPFITAPSAYGAHNWQPMAYSPQTGLVYIPEQEVPAVYVADNDFKPQPQGWNAALDWAKMALPRDPAIRAAARASLKGALVAWDPVKQKQVWRVQYAGPWNGGVLATAGGLVFQGNAAGSVQAFDARSGARLWSSPAETGVVAAPMTYQAGGEQYVAVMAGWGGAFPLAAGELAYASGRVDNVSRLLVFKLGGTAHLPPHTLSADAPPVAPGVPAAPPATIAQGMALYARDCSACHGGAAVNGTGGAIPDLRHSATLADSAGFQSVVRGGALKDNGMAGFSAILTAQQTEAIRAYLVSRAKEDSHGG